MPNETNTPLEPPKRHKPLNDSQTEASMAARAARRSIFTPQRVVGATAVALVGGLVVAPTISNEIHHENDVTTSATEIYNSAKVDKEIYEAATKKVDPANVADIFNITPGHTLYELSIQKSVEQPEFINGDAKTKEWINETVVKTALEQGSYNVDDTFVLERVVIDGKETLVVEKGNGLQLPDVSPASSDESSSDIPSVITH